MTPLWTGALLDQVSDPIASFTADGAYDQDRVYEAAVERHPDAAVIVPPRSSATLERVSRDRSDAAGPNTSKRSPGMVGWDGKSPEGLQRSRKGRGGDRSIQTGDWDAT